MLVRRLVVSTELAGELGADSVTGELEVVDDSADDVGEAADGVGDPADGVGVSTAEDSVVKPTE